MNIDHECEHLHANKKIIVFGCSNMHVVAVRYCQECMRNLMENLEQEAQCYKCWEEGWEFSYITDWIVR